MGYMTDKATRRMVAYKVCNDVRTKCKTSTDIVDELTKCDMVSCRSELEALRSIIDRRIREYNCTPSMMMPKLIDNIKGDIAYLWGKF